LGLACFTLARVWRDNSASALVAEERWAGESPAEEKACCCPLTEEAAEKPLTDKSIYQLGSSWTCHDRRRINLPQLRGKVQVIAMIFTHCVSSCPRLVEDMKRLESQLRGQSLAGVGFVLVSLDPERDSPRVLNEYRERMELCGENWTLLRGHPDDVREFAAVLGVRYKKVGERDLAHSNLISVLNQEGELVAQQEGLGVEPTAIMQAIKRALSAGGDQDGKPAPPNKP
jgi:protein SCO1/2